MGRIALIAWACTAALSTVVLAPTLARLIEGYDRSRILGIEHWLALVVFGLAVVATWIWAARQRASDGASPASGRRRFLLGAVVAAGGIAATLAAAIAPNWRWYSVTVRKIFAVRPPYKADVEDPAWRGARVSEYRRLGRTDFQVSDISLGSGASTGGRQTPAVAREAIERGVNYFDTAPDYSGSGSETRLGEAMKSVRDQMFLATKFCVPTGHLGVENSVEEYMEAVNGSLRRLQTDRVDLVHIHSCDSIDRLMAENAHEAFDRLKEQGKVRFLGVSTHTPNLEAVANAAIDSDRFDVMMLAYHFGAWPTLAEIIDRAASRDIGVVAMKTLRGSKHKGLLWSRDERDSFTQASFKWVLSNPSVSCLVISLWESAQLDEFLYASGKRPDAGDLATLQRYEELTQGTLCRPHCGTCLASCPEDVPIADVLRHRMYFEGFGAEREAMRLYAALDTKADVCIGCAAPCANACPYGVPIPEKTRGTHALLTL
jgi:aryl-alcohol dehydrogenase-like predicted oxidoreductase